VRTIALTTEESALLRIAWITGSTLHVGNSTTVTDNPSCDVIVNDSGYYTCDLWGKYVGIHKSSAAEFVVCELAVFADRNIAPSGTASQSTTWVNPITGGTLPAANAN